MLARSQLRDAAAHDRQVQRRAVDDHRRLAMSTAPTIVQAGGVDDTRPRDLAADRDDKAHGHGCGGGHLPAPGNGPPFSLPHLRTTTASPHRRHLTVAFGDSHVVERVTGFFRRTV